MYFFYFLYDGFMFCGQWQCKFLVPSFFSTQNVLVHALYWGFYSYVQLIRNYTLLVVIEKRNPYKYQYMYCYVIAVMEEI